MACVEAIRWSGNRPERRFPDTRAVVSVQSAYREVLARDGGVQLVQQGGESRRLEHITLAGSDAARYQIAEEGGRHSQFTL